MRLVRCAGRFRLEADQQGFGVQPQVFGVRADEADRVGMARQLAEFAVFDRGQDTGADAQDMADMVDVERALHPPPA